MAASETTYLVFEIGETRFAVPAGAAGEVVLIPALMRPAGLPHALEGLVCIERTVLPVIRLDRLFYGADRMAPGTYTPLIVAQCGGLRAALMVERVVDVATRPDTERMPVDAEATFNGCTVAMLRHNGTDVHILAPDRVLAAEEAAALAAYLETAEARLERFAAAEGAA